MKALSFISLSLAAMMALSSCTVFARDRHNPPPPPPAHSYARPGSTHMN